MDIETHGCTPKAVEIVINNYGIDIGDDLARSFNPFFLK